jgi:hypothetical protein
MNPTRGRKAVDETWNEPDGVDFVYLDVNRFG